MDKVGLCNMAIGNLGISQFIMDLEAEQSNEARVCRIFFDQALDKVLSEFPWSFAKSYADLQDIGSPPSAWLYRYRYPANCLFVRSVTPRGQFPSSSGYFDSAVLEYVNREGFEIIEDQAGGGLAICTNIPEALVTFTKRVTQVNLFPALFNDAFSWCLSKYIAAPLSAAPNMAQLAVTEYRLALFTAGARSLNENREGLRTDQESEFITARG